MAQVAANMLVSVILAIFAENALFSRSLGVERTLLLVDDMGAMVTFGCLTTLSVTLTSLLTYLVSFPLRQDVNAYIYKPLLFILCMVAVYFALSGIARRIRFPRFVKWQAKVRPHYHLLRTGVLPAPDRRLLPGQRRGLYPGHPHCGRGAEKAEKPQCPRFLSRAAGDAALHRHPQPLHLRLYRLPAELLGKRAKWGRYGANL